MSESTLIQPEPSLLRTVPREDLKDASFRKGLGCKECSFTAFSGGYAITEMVVVNEVLRDVIKDHHNLRAAEQVPDSVRSSPFPGKFAAPCW
jgi:type II secretory ATPase GspE/PulE/Tfp pilus assembly ATPase PilB-like protein